MSAQRDKEIASKASEKWRTVRQDKRATTSLHELILDAITEAKRGDSATAGPDSAKDTLGKQEWNDTQRLDWLEQHAADAICDTVFDDGEHHWQIEHAHSNPSPSRATVREAIDAAANATLPPKQKKE